MGYHHQHHKGEDLVKIHPDVAEQLRHYRKKEKYKTSPIASLAASGLQRAAPSNEVGSY